MAFSDYSVYTMATALFGSGAFTVGLHTGNPGSNGTANEVSTLNTGYSRVTVGSWTITSNTGSVTNASEIQFGVPLISWGIITHCSVWKGTNLVFTNQLETSRSVEQGADADFPAGDISVTINK